MWLSKPLRRLVFLSVVALANLGLAQTNALPRISAIDATNYLNQQVVVVDKVVQVAMRSNIWLLHLNQRYPKCPLSATIRKSATNNFPNLDQYLGQRVEITSQIVEYRGRFEVPLTTPSQIKILSATQTAPAPTPVAVQVEPKPVAADSSNAVPASVAATAPVPATSPTAPPAGNDASARTLNWIVGLLGIMSVLLTLGVFMLWRRASDSTHPTHSAGAVVQVLDATPPDASAETWKERALAAEAMAGRQGEMFREKMIPELTEFAKQSLVQGLYAQRNALIETQRKAQAALAEMEARLKTIQAPLNERIRAYENRIAELEREVETQGEEVRELTRATLTLVRRKLEDERQSQGLHTRFN